MIGREIAGRYRIQSKLGEGGMGAVFKAEQISLKRTVAVKLLRPEVASSQLLLRRFNAEAEAVAKLSHPNTVNIYDFGQDSDGTLFIAMEFIEGQSLRHMIHREAPFALRRALSIGLQVASSLSDAHAHSIIHRDLKPDNVMIQQRGRERDIVRVLDFGIAKLRDENRQSQLAMTQAGDMLGTPQYMAPEQIRAETIDGRTDVYALGCLLYEMITARLPYEAPTIMSLLSKHLLEVTVPPSQRRPDLPIPPAIDQLILSAMAKDPKVRPSTMEAFGEQMAELLATLPVDTQQSTAQRPAAGSTAAQAAATPSYSATPSTPAPTYDTHGPQMPGPAFAPPTSPPPGAFPPPGGQVPPSGGYLPPAPGAPAYNPHAVAAPTVAGPAPRGGSNKALWIILAVLVLAGAGVGIYMATRTKEAPPDPWSESGSGSGSETVTPVVTPTPTPTPTPDAATQTGADPWSGGGAAADPDTVDDDGDEADVDVRAPRPQGNASATGKGIPPECVEFAKVIEKLARCDQFPAAARKQMVQAAEQIRAGYGAGLTPAARAQVAAACATGTESYQQMVEMYCSAAP